MALQNQTTPGQPDLLIGPHADAPDDSGGQMSLSVPDSDLALGDTLQSFFEACGGMQPLSLTAHRSDNPAAAERHVVQQPFCIIGRSSECDLVISDPKAGYRHIYAQLISGRWFFLNLARIARTAAGRGQLKSGWFDIDRQLNVGAHVIQRVEIGPQAGIRQIALANAAPSVELPYFKLEILNRAHGSEEPPSIQFCAPVTLIGACPGCDLYLKNESVSKIHASLVLTPGSLWVVDLLGRGGVRVDGHPAYWKQVHDGTLLQIGRYQLRVRFDSSRMITRTARLDPQAAPGYTSLLAPGAVSGGSLSEGAVLTLIGQLAEMQNQFFEQSRMQMQWMADMMAHVGRAQQESAKRDLARIEEITTELREIRSQLADGATRVPPAPSGVQDNHLDRSLLPNAGIPEGQDPLPPLATSPARDAVEPKSNADDLRPDSQTAASPPLPQPIQQSSPESLRVQVPESIPGQISEHLPAPTSSPTADVPRNVPQPVAGQRTALPPGASSADAHAWLTQRMATLSQEHTSVWRRLMNTLSGTPNP